MLVGNKSDMTEQRQVTTEEGQELANSYQMPFLETSARNSQNVDEAFVTMTKEIKDKNLTQKLTANKNVATVGQGRSLQRQPEQTENEETQQNV